MSENKIKSPLTGPETEQLINSIRTGVNASIEQASFILNAAISAASNAGEATLSTVRECVEATIEDMKDAKANGMDPLKLIDTMTPNKSTWESIVSGYKTVNKYGSMPAYGAGYGVGYVSKMAVTPIADLLEMVPLLGGVVEGFRDGVDKADAHYEMIEQTGRDWINNAQSAVVVVAPDSKVKGATA
jgi:hypothetical protein